MNEEEDRDLSGTAKLLRGKLSDEEVFETVDQEGVYDIQGTRSNGTHVDMVGFTLGGLQVDCGWAPFNFSEPAIGRYQIGANRKGDNISILGEIPYKGPKEIQRKFAQLLIGEMHEKAENGLPDLELANIVREKIDNYPKFLAGVKKPTPSLN